MSELEQYSRINDVVVSELETTYRCYARVTATESWDPPEQEPLSLEQKVIAFFDSRGINVESKDIEKRKMRNLQSLYTLLTENKRTA